MDGLMMKYFVLKPAGDTAYAGASREALRSYAREIKNVNATLANDLYNWADDEEGHSVDRLVERVQDTEEGLQLELDL